MLRNVALNKTMDAGEYTKTNVTTQTDTRTFSNRLSFPNFLIKRYDN